ncbi:hypothetical protein SCB49_06982 [unidentified eubacterium SCB49]|nr:hypothetical protein SCB49_06982 [unidentified eubacterium SCB49]
MMSGKYDTLFTPAGYAFSIWGLIYLLLFGFVIYQSRSLFTKVRDDAFIERTGWWFILSCIANSAWCYLFVIDSILISTFVIFFMLFCVLQIVIRNAMELWDAPISVIVFLWWPFVIYSGWLTVACIANVTLYLTKIGWDGFGISAETWTLIMIGVATFINLIVTWKRNMREFALVGAWALVAIAVANADGAKSIINTAYVAAGILIASSLIHALKNRATNPVKKCVEYMTGTK